MRLDLTSLEWDLPSPRAGRHALKRRTSLTPGGTAVFTASPALLCPSLATSGRELVRRKLQSCARLAAGEPMTAIAQLGTGIVGPTGTTKEEEKGTAIHHINLIYLCSSIHSNKSFHQHERPLSAPHLSLSGNPTSHGREARTVTR